MSYLLFFIWLIILSWSLTRIRFVKDSGIAGKTVIAIFMCKIFAGMLGGWMVHQTPGVDTWKYHYEGLAEYHLLFNDPEAYFTNLFHSGYAHGFSGVFVSQNSFWNDLKDNLIIKIISVLHIFSEGNYYVNVVLYNFLILFGNIALFRVFDNLFPSQRKLLIVSVFLLPSLLYFGSTIHKDGIMYAAIGTLLYVMYQGLKGSGFTIKRIFLLILSLLLIFLFRNYVFIALLPALTAMIIAYKKNYSPVISFAVVYFFIAIVFFNLHSVLPAVDLPNYIVQKQADFLGLQKANTTIPLNTLSADFMSYLVNAPQAIAHGLFRPIVTDASLSKLLLPLSLELAACQLLIIIFLFFKKDRLLLNDPFVLFCLFFAVSVCIITGFTVPVLGAIVRYRSIYLPLLITPFICNTDWKKLAAFIRFRK